METVEMTKSEFLEFVKSRATDKAVASQIYDYDCHSRLGRAEGGVVQTIHNYHYGYAGVEFGNGISIITLYYPRVTIDADGVECELLVYPHIDGDDDYYCLKTGARINGVTLTDYDDRFESDNTEFWDELEACADLWRDTDELEQSLISDAQERNN